MYSLGKEGTDKIGSLYYIMSCCPGCHESADKTLEREGPLTQPVMNGEYLKEHVILEVNLEKKE